ncbi:cardiolipin synthase (CMP-forming) [Chiloscyllium plagiosum]|uniref:cardiolipin synthase (CMP-forming) n=1 Tax=Chiloscyllium plagiosum TaxID=36176 RepID=UPI001CB824BF|nr:cardiolipin synthase (CMP-forming) [Chiloscyllium plagiosum]
MFLWRSRWAIGRRAAAALRLQAGLGPLGWAPRRRPPSLSFPYPGPGRRCLGLGLAWWPPARVRRREAVPSPGLVCSRRYGAARPAAKREAADPSSGAGEERAACPDLYENPWTIPNLLCVARIGLSPYLGYLIVEEEFNLALGLFILAGITDLLDGYIARNWANQKSALGSALDPLADKILISVLYVSLTCVELIPASLTAMVLMRDITLIAAGFYIRYRTVPPPRTLSKYFNPCYATARLKPTFISKVNTAVQLVLVAASLAAPVFQYVDSVFLHCLWYITALTTMASAYSYYLHGKSTVQVLNRMK